MTLCTQDMTSSLHTAQVVHAQAPRQRPVTGTRLPAASRGEPQPRAATLAARAWYQRTSAPLRA